MLRDLLLLLLPLPRVEPEREPEVVERLRAGEDARVAMASG